MNPTDVSKAEIKSSAEDVDNILEDDQPEGDSFSAPWNAGYRDLTDAEWQALAENSL